LAPNFKSAGAPKCLRPVPGQRCDDDEVTVFVYEATKLYCGQAFLLGIKHCTGVINSSLGKKCHNFSFFEQSYNKKNKVKKE